MRIGSKHLARTLLAVLSLTCVATGCLSGPSPLSRGFDGWVEERAAEKPRLHGNLLQDVLPVYPIFGGVLGFVDWVVMNPYSFWTGGVGWNEEAKAEPPDTRLPASDPAVP